MTIVKNFFASRRGIIVVGAIIGGLAPLLQNWGNPANMGICVACFERDIAGALGLHRAAVVQYMRPEIIGFVLGSLIAAYIFEEFRPRTGSAPIVRFFLGAFAMRGTPALLASAVKVGEIMGQPEVFGFLVGDTGLGDGSRRLYKYLCQHLEQSNFDTLAFHYLQPYVGWHNRVLSAVNKMTRKPILIADAGFMYVAKMSGHSAAYDLFTPDIGELAFLADESAPHPFYTRGFLLHEENRVPDFITRPYTHKNAAHYLLVKGRTDYLANKEGVQGVIDHPLEDAMEAIGGTGDTLTGIVAALTATGMDIPEASLTAAKVNRLAGVYAHPTPATQVQDIIQYIPEALREILSQDARGR